jgi:hypothetical protein
MLMMRHGCSSIIMYRPSFNSRISCWVQAIEIPRGAGMYEAG